MSRIEEIDDFLRTYAKIYDENPTLDICYDTFYDALMIYDLNLEGNPDINIRPLFENWIKRYENSSLKVKPSVYKPQFLKFTTKNHVPYKTHKLYMSFQKDKIEECVNRVFDFIERNNMESDSKISDTLRSDGVVIRLDNKMDVMKFFDYASSDQILTESSLKTNPFLMRYKNIAFAYDGYLSYNAVVSILLEEYFKEKKHSKTLGNVSINDFKIFVYNYKKEVFSSYDKLNEFVKKESFLDYGKERLGYTVNNYEQVMRLILNSLEKDFTYEEYVNFVSECNDDNKNKEYAIYYEAFLSNVSNKSNKENNIEELKGILDDYIDLAIKKYGKEGTKQHLAHYIDGHIESITRSASFRSLFKEKLSPQIVSELMNKDIDAYVTNFIPLEDKSVSYQIVFEACIETYRKYGYEQLYNALEKGVLGNYAFFTNNNKRCREKLYNHIPNDQFSLIIDEIGKRNAIVSDDVFEKCALAIKEQCELFEKSKQLTMKS